MTARATRSLSVKCNYCGQTSDVQGVDAAEMLDRADQAHDLLRPECPAGSARRKTRVCGAPFSLGENIRGIAHCNLPPGHPGAHERVQAAF